MFNEIPTNSLGLRNLLEDMDRMMKRAQMPAKYPPYNIIQESENMSWIQIALAGWHPDEISILEDRMKHMLVITGEPMKEPDQVTPTYLYQGIANRKWKLEFMLGDYHKVEKASFDNGTLTIGVKRELPEELKPREIPINNLLLEHQDAA